MLSCYLIVKNADQTLNRTLNSVRNLADEIVVVDDGSTDSSRKIAEKHGARVISFIHPSEGEKRKFALEQCKGDWILCLDADEVIPHELADEIRSAIETKEYDGYLIPYQNYFLGHELHYGGENYSFMRLFQKSKAGLENTPIHAFHTIPSKKVGTLKQKMHHYSYRSLWQVYSKFTNYAVREAHKKLVNGESTSLKKITMYPSHMFWARFVKDKGYKDGIIRIPLDLGFAYMEWLTYVLMFFITK